MIGVSRGKSVGSSVVRDTTYGLTGADDAVLRPETLASLYAFAIFTDTHVVDRMDPAPDPVKVEDDFEVSTD